MRALVGLLSFICVNQYTKFQVPNFTDYNDMIRAKF